MTLAGMRRPRIRRILGAAWTMAVLGLCTSCGGTARPSVGTSARPIGVAAPEAVALAPLALADTPGRHTLITVGAPTRRLPQHYLGLSLEPSEVSDWTGFRVQFARLVEDLEGRGGGIVLRVGGESADSAFLRGYRLNATPYVRGGEYALGDRWVAEVAQLAQMTDARLILDVNLAAHSPGMAAAEVRAVWEALGDRLIAVEIGNEPDLYSAGFVGNDRFDEFKPGQPQWEFTLTPDAYARLFDRYVRAIRAASPRLLVAGPSTMAGNGGWVNKLLQQPAAQRVSLVSVHAYAPYHGCAEMTSPLYPRSAGYLTEQAATEPDAAVAQIIQLADRAHLPVQIDEAGSAVCGGLLGRTTSFSTALWAPEFLMSFLNQGVRGVNVHVRSRLLNSPFLVGPSGLIAEPAFYGMMLTSRLLDGADRLIATGGGTADLHVWAVSARSHRQRCLLINDSASAKLVWMADRDHGAGTLVRMAEGLDGPEVGGQVVDDDSDQLVGARQSSTVVYHDGHYAVDLPAMSAALVSLPH